MPAILTVIPEPCHPSGGLVTVQGASPGPGGGLAVDDLPHSWEPRVLSLLLALLIEVPPLVKELYPFSLPTMFSVAPRQLAEYTVTDGEGRSVRLERVGLHVPEWHDPPVRTLGRSGYGRPIPPGVHVIGEVAPVHVVETAVRQGWRDDATLPDPLLVRQEVYAQGAGGRLRLMAEHLWTWSRMDRPESPVVASPGSVYVPPATGARP